MPGNSVRQASKNVSRSKRAAIAKNTGRVEAAIRGSLEGCTYGRITKALGNKTFILLDATKREHQAHIRGKMARIGIDDVVLLNERDYETRAGTEKAVYDIMAVLDKKDAAYLIKHGAMPKWMLSVSTSEEAGTEEEDIFEYDLAATDILVKRREINLNDEDVDIDNI